MPDGHVQTTNCTYHLSCASSNLMVGIVLVTYDRVHIPVQPRVTKQLQVSSALQVVEKYQSVNMRPFGKALFISIVNDKCN